ncbi:hypothetical protein DYBT9275_05555 [Dyadobacter sp. CECT 9275]|uniref:Acyl-CoA reductase n=1 Tax=Dyadobacter helix TaxID=2822344 RepID=A0A916NNQ7_9BACT|nr:acyl-CoA reductase [Dyadobacter sp. CECT 9275]CAG5016441.1 hypothetical protein DYBT9275_05555 [Dyadobacter sp. CECT 9275]
MISRNKRINAFAELGSFILSAAHQETVEEWATGAYRRNNWFSPANSLLSLHAIAAQFLSTDKLSRWVADYPEAVSPSRVGVVMAGNIPAVGFHDILCVLISGHRLVAKPSSDDPVLIPALLEQLIKIEPSFQEYIKFADRLNEAEAYIATGSDNTARYFHYYFAKKPNIIRRNRTSVAALSGNESMEELSALGQDILQYYGLGCRNVSKLYVPEGYDFTRFYQAIEPMKDTYVHHHKFFNNYEYNKSIVLINKVPHLDNGFLILSENPALVSPISMVHYETYASLEDLNSVLAENSEKIQCIAAPPDLKITGSIAFGKSQQPGLADYADNIDTMEFLAKL